MPIGRRIRRRRAADRAGVRSRSSFSSRAASSSAQAGVLVTRVIDIKPQAGGKLFVIVDAGMTELMRPMLYGAYHRIEPVDARPARERSATSSDRSAKRPIRSAGIAVCRLRRSAI